jgi:hypothetical protein
MTGGSPSDGQLLINALTGKVGPSTQVTGNATYRELKAVELVYLVYKVADDRTLSYSVKQLTETFGICFRLR